MEQTKEQVHEQHHVRIEEWLQELEQTRNADALLEQASLKARTTGNREDLSRLMNLRRKLL